MISMTGYGRGVASYGRYEVVAEVSSVNKKNLDVSSYLPREWQAFDVVIGERLRDVVNRGKVSVSIRIERVQRSGAAAQGNADLVEETLHQLAALAERNRIPFEPDLGLLFQITSQADVAERPPLLEECGGEAKEALTEAIREFVSMRQREGRVLAKDLLNRAGRVREWVATIAGYAKEVVPHYRDLLLQRLRQAGLEWELDDERLLRELMLFADRCDISEEVTRLDSHLEQLFEFFQTTDEPIGRKAEFLLQEINRECNTIGSKAGDVRISRLIVESKNEIERIREQVQNVE
ncbi:MAG: YicC/YloC family endoribonuclease [Opitutales bacterium]